MLAPGRLVGRRLLATYAKIDLRISVFSGTRKGYFFSFANRKVTCIHNKACDAPLQTNWLYYLEDRSNIVTAEITSTRSPRRLGGAVKLCIQASIFCRTCVSVTRPGTSRLQVEVQKFWKYLYFSSTYDKFLTKKRTTRNVKLLSTSYNKHDISCPVTRIFLQIQKFGGCSPLSCVREKKISTLLVR